MSKRDRPDEELNVKISDEKDLEVSIFYEPNEEMLGKIAKVLSHRLGAREDNIKGWSSLLYSSMFPEFEPMSITLERQEKELTKLRQHLGDTLTCLEEMSNKTVKLHGPRPVVSPR